MLLQLFLHIQVQKEEVKAVGPVRVVLEKTVESASSAKTNQNLVALVKRSNVV